ncbi:MAG: phosphate acetyltransferase [Elusimicrobiota bacterium]
MNPILERVRERAKKSPKKIVFAEGEDARVLAAAIQCAQEKIAEPIILGDEEKISSLAGSLDLSLGGCLVINPEKAAERKDFSAVFYQLRFHKGITIAEAEKTVLDPQFFAALYVQQNKADGFLSGATHTTASTIQAAFQVIGLAKDESTLSGFFLISVPDCVYGAEGNFLFADCGVIPDPSARQLAQIAIATARSCRKFLEAAPKVALLSFSTRGSAESDELKKIREALRIVREKDSSIIIDGELQADAALDKEVAQLKGVGDSLVAGRANVLIFPDLNSGNIGYKLVQRLAKAQAVGPILQGLAKPANDLSRGCSQEDIVNVCAITVLQAM